MTTFLMLLLILCIYPIAKVVFYMPISALLKNYQKQKSLSLILTAVMTIILLIVMLVLGYTLTNNQSIFNSGPQFYSFIGFTYILGLFSAVVLLVLKFINRKSTDAQTLEIFNTSSETIPEVKQNKQSGFENIILLLVIAGFAGFIIFIFYIA